MFGGDVADVVSVPVGVVGDGFSEALALPEIAAKLTVVIVLG